MPLPWLIGAAIAAIGAAVVASVNDNDNSVSVSDSGEEEERRRRKAAERKRKKREKKVAQEAAQAAFIERGENMGIDISNSLEGWVSVKFEQSPAFLPVLGSSGYEVIKPDTNYDNEEARRTQELLSFDGLNFEMSRDNLQFYASIYAISLQGDKIFRKTCQDLDRIKSELVEVQKIRREIEKLQEQVDSDA